MNRESRWRIKNVILIVLAIACYIIGVKNYYELRKNYQSVSVQLQGEGTTKEQVKTLLEEEKEKYGMEEAQKEEKENEQEKEKKEEKEGQQEEQVIKLSKVKKVPEITAYEKEEHMKITDTRYGKTKNVTKYLVYGGMNQILPIQICTGNYVYEDDYEGCILDKDTAYALYGSLDIIGQPVLIDEKISNKNTESNRNSLQGEETITIRQREYYVRGILDTSHPVVMVQARDDKTQFHYLQFDYGNSSRGREYVEQLMMVYSLGSSAAIVDQNLIVRLAGNVLFLPWLLAGIVIILKRVKLTTGYFKQKEFMKKSPKFFVKLIIPSILAVIGIVITARRFAFFPLQYIPTKWSDFNSVSRTIERIRNHMEEFNYMTPTIREVLLKENIAMLILAVVSMIVLIWVVIERIRALVT